MADMGNDDPICPECRRGRMKRKLRPWKTGDGSSHATTETMVEMEICTHCKAAVLTPEGSRAASEANKGHHWISLDRWRRDGAPDSTTGGERA